YQPRSTLFPYTTLFRSTIVDIFNGNPLLVKEVATVRETSAPRVGQVGLNDNDDAVEGIILMRKGENAAEVLKRVKAKIHELNTRSEEHTSELQSRENLV